MTTVEMESKADKILVTDIRSESHTAFIGKCGKNGPLNALYLVVHGGVVLASKPWQFWAIEHKDNHFALVDRWVDITITVDGE